MNRISPRTRRTTLLLILLAAAALVRCWGIGFGLPHTLARPDEERVLGSALNVARGQFNPGFFSYPSLYIYLAGALEWLYYLAGRVTGRFDSMEAFVASWPLHYTGLWLVGRLLTAAFGTATVWLVYRASAEAFCRRAGTLAAFFLAFAFLHVRDSHFAVTDVPMACFVIADVWLLLRAVRLRSVGAFAFAGIVAGLAASTKYNAVLLVVPAAVAALAPASDRRGHPRAFAAFVICLVAAFLAGTPYAVLDWRQFATDIAFEAAHLRGGHAIPLGPGWTYHLSTSLRYGLGTPLLTAGLLGIVVATFRNLRAAAVVFAFPVAYYALAGGGLTVFTRYMVAVVPFLCIAAGVLVDSVTSRATGLLDRMPAHPQVRAFQPLVALALAIGLVATSTAAALALDRRLAKTDTRVLAARWIGAAVPVGSSIYQTGEHYGHAQLEIGGQQPRFVHWSWDDARGGFTLRGRPVDGLPDWIVVQRSGLVAYSAVPHQIEELVAARYTQIAAFTGSQEGAPLVYDQQDAFYVPMRGFEAITRPGPNLFIYRRTDR